MLIAKAENRVVLVTEAGSYLRLIDFCITQLKAQGPSRFCNESKGGEEECVFFLSGVPNMLQRLVPQPAYVEDAAGIWLLWLLSRAIYPRRRVFQHGRLDTRFHHLLLLH